MRYEHQLQIFWEKKNLYTVITGIISRNRFRNQSLDIPLDANERRKIFGDISEIWQKRDLSVRSGREIWQKRDLSARSGREIWQRDLAEERPVSEIWQKRDLSVRSGRRETCQ